MADADQSPSEAQDPEPTAHAYNAPGLSPKQFLLRVMHAPDAAIRDRMRAASELLRLYPRDWMLQHSRIASAESLSAVAPYQHHPIQGPRTKDWEITVILAISLIKAPPA